MGKTALVTGASAGLGRELARLFAGDGHDLVLVARRRPALEALAAELAERGVKARVMAEDLADPAAPERILYQLQRDGVAIEYLVNNAGFGSTGTFATATWSVSWR